MERDPRYSDPPCECGDGFCAGCEGSEEWPVGARAERAAAVALREHDVRVEGGFAARAEEKSRGQKEATPGPWEWVDDELLGPLGSGEDDYDDKSMRRRVVETDSGYYGPHGPDRPLIAAAPDMRDALLEAFEYFDQRADGDEGRPNTAAQLAGVMRAALAKAGVAL